MSSQAAPPSGYVHLILSREERKEPFYLEVPITIVTSLCEKPRKYLRYLGWCVLGAVGTLAREGNEIDLDGELEDKGIYDYLLPDDAATFAHAVDLEVIKQRSQFPSETTTTRENFRHKLLPRDGYCVWTGYPGTGMHIIPFSKGEEWLRLIIANRPGYEDEDVESITINDIRNGLFVNDAIHHQFFDPRAVVVLKTPNPILTMIEVPPRHPRAIIENPGVSPSYPHNSRYTMQWLVVPLPSVVPQVPNNNDATFADHSLSKPADLLLHYNYGAAAVKQWGKNLDVLQEREDRLLPPQSVSAPLGPPKTKHDRTIAINKRAGTASQQGAGSMSTTGNAADSGHWDEHDAMLYFWGNSKAAQERHAQKEQERTASLEKWRTTVV